MKGVIVGINQENPFIEENTMITIKVNGMNKEIFQDIVFTSEREKTIRPLAKVVIASSSDLPVQRLS